MAAGGSRGKPVRAYRSLATQPPDQGGSAAAPGESGETARVRIEGREDAPSGFLLVFWALG